MHDKSHDRDLVARRLAEDLIGPRAVDERLTTRPSDIYLTGDSLASAHGNVWEDDERLGAAGTGTGDDSDGEAEQSEQGRFEAFSSRHIVQRFFLRHPPSTSHL